MTHQTADPRPTPHALNPNVAFLLWDTADRVPEHPAIVERDRATSYADLRDRAAGIASALRASGITPGDRE